MANPYILIGERDPFMQHTLKQILKEHFDLSFVGDGAMLVARARARPPDVIVMELLLPTLDGFQVCRQLKNDPHTRSIPILVYSLLVAEERALQAGADAFLRKPQPPEKLRQAILDLLNARATQKDKQISAHEPSAISQEERSER